MSGAKNGSNKEHHSGERRKTVIFMSHFCTGIAVRDYRGELPRSWTELELLRLDGRSENCCVTELNTNVIRKGRRSPRLLKVCYVSVCLFLKSEFALYYSDTSETTQSVSPRY